MTVVATQIKPLADRVLVKPLAKEERTASGIVLPDTAKEKPQQGRVLAAGSGRVTESGERIALEAQEGDTVIFAKYAGTEIKVEDEDLLILSERDVLAIVK